MIVGFVAVLILWVVVDETTQSLLAETEVVELILEDDTRMEQSVFQELVALGDLLWCERYLCQVILTLVRVVLGTVGNLLQRVGYLGGMGERITHLVGHLLGTLCRGDNGLVDALPVVHVLTFAPLALELCLALAYGQRRIEVPLSVIAIGIAVACVVLPFVIVVAETIGVTSILSLVCLLFRLFVFLFLFLLLQCGNHTVDGSVAVFLAHACQLLQRVLQGYGIGVRHQFVEYLRTVGQLLVVFALFV